MPDNMDFIVISSLLLSYREVTLGDRMELNRSTKSIGKAPQSVFSKEQTALLQAINESPLSVEEKNSLLRYLYFSAVSMRVYHLSLLGSVYALFGE